MGGRENPGMQQDAAVIDRHNFETAKGVKEVRLLIAFVLPWLTFFTIGRPFLGVICLGLQATLIDWLPATIWAVYALSQCKTDKNVGQPQAVVV